MKPVVVCGILLLVRVFLMQFSQHSVLMNYREIKELKSELVAARNCKAELLSKNNQLCLRERICNYASSNLGLFNPISSDSTASARISYVRENKKNDNVMYSLIDFISPEAQALNPQNE
ncbi:MAG TPA: hypothetical protein PKJ08_09055 [Candidatus Cloacimonadota bacterium]|jgi:hypothetical protein|nr:hypothetical protein [Candidatus Cloacimonadota bacterium]HOD54660.1 hypothetical protein [Candidatus Cloacimonadota bacterium]HPM00594.1 hypothetical protein [Candidatus Cloacimonadota bacterium]